MSEIEQGLGGHKNNIRFRFRCTAFGVSYYDALWLDSEHKQHSVEVCFKDGFVESHPVLSYRYDVRIDDPELLGAWKDFCLSKRIDYLDWLEHNPQCKEFSQLEPFRGATHTEPDCCAQLRH